ncbi:MAG: DNA polymerase IV [Oscillospiraceae bacterium]|jgi:DNA polymerase-4|nr:DNA polymerase IV [Oscillospiraceae bacterium]
MTDRTIFHCDCDCFFASVEETFNPAYKLIPMAVAGDPETRRGIILAKNQLAKKAGVKTAETIWSARQKCPDLLLCPPRRNTYSVFCERVNAIYETYTDQVERVGVDESFLDLTGSLHLFAGDAIAVAKELQRRVSDEIGITISIGISWNKIFAKLGSDQNKPNGIFSVTSADFRETVWPLPAGDLFGVGKNAAESLRKWGIHTIGDLAQTDITFLRRQFGKMGEHLHRCSNGLDDSTVRRVGEHEPPKSIGNSFTFKRDLLTPQDIQTGVAALSDRVASRLRAHHLKCRTIQVTIKDTTLKSIQRQKAASRATHASAEIARLASDIIAASWQIGKPIRLIGITAQNLVQESARLEQLSLFETRDDDVRTERLEKAVDQIRGKYGCHSIQPAVILGNDLGIRDAEIADQESDD